MMALVSSGTAVSETQHRDHYLSARHGQINRRCLLLFINQKLMQLKGKLCILRWKKERKKERKDKTTDTFKQRK